ncbi:MAG: hypothetical protein Q9217_003664 [Psora testacea]
MVFITQDPSLDFHSELPTAFASIEAARNSLDYHWNGCIRMINRQNVQGKPVGSEADRQHYLKIFRDWNTALEALLSDNTLDARSMQGARVLQISHTFATITVQAQLGSGFLKESDWDLCLHYHHRIIALAEEAFNGAGCDSNDSDRVQEAPSFSLDMNIVWPLYAVTHKCRDPVLCRKAVALLKSSPRQESIWDSVLAGRVAEKLISIEEKGLGVVRS